MDIDELVAESELQLENIKDYLSVGNHEAAALAAKSLLASVTTLLDRLENHEVEG